MMIQNVQKTVYRFTLKLMDLFWKMEGGNLYEDYPPSFYYLYTLEERNRIIEEDNKRLRELIEDL